MLIDTLIKRDQITMIRQGFHPPGYQLFFTRGEEAHITTFFYYAGHPSNLFETFVLGTMLINAYHYETLSEVAWHQKYSFIMGSAIAETYRGLVKMRTGEVRALLGPLYDEYIQALKDDHILNPEHLCDYCMKVPGEEKTIDLHNWIGEMTYYACPDCNDKIVNDIKALIEGKKPIDENSNRPCLYHWLRDGYCRC